MKKNTVMHSFYRGRYFIVILVVAMFVQAKQVELSSLNGSNGFILNGGDTEFEGSGYSVSSAGDVNGDGIDDVIIGATAAKNLSGVQTGASYIIFGSIAGFPAVIDVSNLNGTNGFVVYGESSNDRFGHAVDFAGDVNGDSIDDIIIGASLVDTENVTNAGACYVLYGRSSGFPAVIDAASISADIGFVITGIAEDDRVGDAVSNAGDINADGIDDMIVGVRLANPNGHSSGAAYVVFGNSQVGGFPDTFSFSDLDGTNGFTLTSGETNRTRFGVAVNSAGDINGDGLSDIVVGGSSTGPNFSGSAYVLFGSNEDFSSLVNFTNVNGENGFVFNGISANDRAGFSVSVAGDINADGVDDLVIGAFGADTNGEDSGSSYVVYGSTEGFPSLINAISLDGVSGFTINGISIGDAMGRYVSAAGDVNGDGIDDMIIGANGVDANDQDKSGASYVVFGSQEDFASTVIADSFIDGNGIVLNGVAAGDEAGISVSAAGDINNDGIDDMIIGAWRADPNGINSAGSSYIVFGSDVIFSDSFE